jgi:hypothetical protein
MDRYVIDLVSSADVGFVSGLPIDLEARQQDGRNPHGLRRRSLSCATCRSFSVYDR